MYKRVLKEKKSYYQKVFLKECYFDTTSNRSRVAENRSPISQAIVSISN